MCQLTFLHTLPRYSEIIPPIISGQLVKNADKNEDGWGIFNGDSICKSELSADKTSNLGEICKDNLTNNSCIGHVRKTSKGKTKKENSHPFETRDFVLAHNGTLELKDEIKEKYEKVDKIDSEIFLLELQYDYTQNPELEFQELVKKTMEKFTGKFALLIYHKEKNTYYICRGKATLYKTFIYIKGKKDLRKKKIGLIVNTDRQDLIEQSIVINQVIPSITKHKIWIDVANVELLEKETVFVFKEDELDIEEIGEIKQEFTVKKSTYKKGKSWNGWQQHSGKSAKQKKKKFDVFFEESEIIKNYRDKYGITNFDFSFMLWYIYGLSICDLNLEAIDELALEIFPWLEENNFLSVEKRKIWSDIVIIMPSTQVYDLAGVECPYFMNTIPELKSILSRVEALERDTIQIPGDLPK